MPEATDEHKEAVADAMRTIENIGLLKEAIEQRTKELVGEALKELLKSEEFLAMLDKLVADAVQSQNPKYGSGISIGEPYRDNDRTIYKSTTPYKVQWSNKVDNVLCSWTNKTD